MKKLIEAEIEKIFVEKFQKALERYNIQVVGSWDIKRLTDENVKGEEEANVNGVLAVKISPRQYATPTVPDTTINGAISLSVRADVDWSGEMYLGVVAEIMTELEKLQECYCSTHSEYSIPELGYCVTGFQLGQGDSSVNPTSKIFGYTHNFTMFGVIHNQEW